MTKRPKWMDVGMAIGLSLIVAYVGRAVEIGFGWETTQFPQWTLLLGCAIVGITAPGLRRG